MNIRRKIFDIVEPRYNSQDSIQTRAYDWCMLIAIAMGVLPLMFREQTRWFYLCDLISCTLFIIDYLLRWFTADYRMKKKGLLAFVIYPITPMAIVDLLSILPTFNFVQRAFKLTRIIRLLKIIRVVRVIRYFEPLRIIGSVIKNQRAILFTVLSLAIIYVFITALIMFNAEEQINPETGTFLFPTFFDAFYWASCTLTTVGYGDLYPISTTGRVISIVSSIVGIAIIALPSGIITAAYMDELKKRKKQRNNLLDNKVKQK